MLAVLLDLSPAFSLLQGGYTSLKTLPTKHQGLYYQHHVAPR
ncbi:MAG: hypothetical protein ACTS73_00610 [Arsenophonus sp. NEOnobi-MAG3]